MLPRFETTQHTEARSSFSLGALPSHSMYAALPIASSFFQLLATRPVHRAASSGACALVFGNREGRTGTAQANTGTLHLHIAQPPALLLLHAASQCCVVIPSASAIAPNPA